MTRLKQALVIILGFAAAAAMAVLGIWQLEVYGAQGDQAAQVRAEAPPVPLTTVAAAGSAVRDGYGRSVRARGRYVPESQRLLPLPGQPGRVRVLTALELANGTAVPVVRGITSPDRAPAPPLGPVDQVGVLLPSEETGDGPATTVRVPALAQEWPQRLLDGYLTLSPADAAAQGLEPAPPRLPEARGRLRNAAYALQWWVFAAFAGGMAVRIARDLDVRDALPELTEVGPGEPQDSLRPT